MPAAMKSWAWKSDRKGRLHLPKVRSFMERTLRGLGETNMRLPVTATFNVIEDFKRMPTYQPMGYDPMTRMYWLNVESEDVNLSLTYFTLEVGRRIFRENLQEVIPEYGQWANKLDLWMSSSVAFEAFDLRYTLQSQLTPRTPNPTEFPYEAHSLAADVLQYPWARLVYDYEIAFGVLLSLHSFEFLNNSAAANNFYYDEVEGPSYSPLVPGLRPPMEGETIEMGVVSRPQFRRDTNDQKIIRLEPAPPLRHGIVPRPQLVPDTYVNGLRDSIEYIWTNFMANRSERERAEVLEAVFITFQKEIARRRSVELRSLEASEDINMPVLREFTRHVSWQWRY